MTNAIQASLDGTRCGDIGGKETANLSDEMEGLFSTGSQMTRFILLALLGILTFLMIIGKLWEVYTNCKPTGFRLTNQYVMFRER
ncbi:hypothetical protein pdam_00010499 [Pocillopora damicornis]|uniref:Uncharacterized protein n=1 Tax=Pocillopora damicornis TaxID=46731 RepID=A0A3M6V198_POCDA|nr:hypothetical protein pdam_00010499 [Pocillopora damicornis]